jgi:hypothetical protein
MLTQRESLGQQILAQSRYSEPGRLNRYEMRCFSENGEDGIIAEIFRQRQAGFHSPHKLDEEDPGGLSRDPA